MQIEHILPYRPYSLALRDLFQEFLYLQSMKELVKQADSEGRSLTKSEVLSIRPVIMFATPKKAFANIVSPIINGQLLTFGLSYYLSDVSFISSLNGTVYNYIPIKYEVEENGETKLKSAKLSKPLAMTMTYNISLQTPTMQQMEELELRWAMEFAEEKGIVVNNTNYKIIWNGSFTNNTELTPGVGDKDYIRKDTTLEFPIAHFPQKLLEDYQTSGLMKEFYVKFINEVLEDDDFNILDED